MEEMQPKTPDKETWLSDSNKYGEKMGTGYKKATPRAVDDGSQFEILFDRWPGERCKQRHTKINYKNTAKSSKTINSVIFSQG